jgi:hypothetical protein
MQRLARNGGCSTLRSRRLAVDQIRYFFVPERFFALQIADLEPVTLSERVSGDAHSRGHRAYRAIARQGS